MLLLITTLAAMLMAHRGLPPLQLIFFTLLGGALAAGGAGAINHYLDRDVDELMGRTSSRPIPAGVVPPLNAPVLRDLPRHPVVHVDGRVRQRALGGADAVALLFYVFVYTRWLKRWTSLNIVIGGAAGAIPPVVGIAAVTNEVNWLAIWLFTIIFVWTPPHFWALSLLMQREYAAAGIPMLPIVRGEEETRRQILWYSLAMVGADGRRLDARACWARSTSSRRWRSAASSSTTRSASGARRRRWRRGGCSASRSSIWRCSSWRWWWTARRSCEPATHSRGIARIAAWPVACSLPLGVACRPASTLPVLFPAPQFEPDRSDRAGRSRPRT